MPIVYEVVEYLEGYYKDSFNIRMDRHNASKAALAPLLSVSERWRKAALESICDNCMLDYNHSCEIPLIEFSAWPTDVPPSWPYMSHLVKLIFVSATLEKILSDGVLCSTLTWQQSESVVLPAARTLILNLMSTADRSLGFGDSPHHTSAEKTVVVNFAHRLKRLAPAATDLHLFITPTGGTQARHTQFYGLLISTLCRAGIKGVHVYAEQATIPVSLDVQCLSLLTKITQGKGVACGPFARLAYLNANTLQMLSINVGTEDDWLGLIYGGSKVSATFHRLDELILQFTDVSYEEIWTAIDFLAPFPALWMLEVFDRYPFDDDLLFRRNGKTMKHLRIPFCALVENIMGRFKVLSRSGVSRMDLVRIEAVLDADDADDTDDVDDVDDAGDADDADDADDEFEAERVDAAIKQQLHCILKTTAALFISEDTFDMLLRATIEAAPSTSTLRHLNFGGVEFCLGGVIKVIAALTSLVSLTCSVRNQGLAIGTNPESSCLRCFRKKYYPLSKKFKVLRVLGTDVPLVDEVASVAMHIAVVCPNFAFVDLPHEHRKELSLEIARAIAKRPFRPFADSIRHLMFKD